MKKRPPMIGTLPPPVNERPTCAECGRPLVPTIHDVREDSQLRDGVAYLGKRIGRRWTGRYDGYGHFCSLRHAAAWANRLLDKTRGKV